MEETDMKYNCYKKQKLLIQQNLRLEALAKSSKNWKTHCGFVGLLVESNEQE